MSTKHSIAALAFVIVLAIFFRFWQFGSIPAGLYQDEAMNGADALSSLETGIFSAIGGPASGWKAFYPNNNGREGLIIWLDALAIKAFGTEPWVLRLFPAIAGVLAVLGLYFLAKELFNVKVALASGFFMATGFWAVNFSRTGFRAALMVPILIWSFYFLLRGFKISISDIDIGNRYRKSIIFFVLAGALFGLGFYTYISFRFAPVLALLAFLPFFIRQNKKELWLDALYFTIAVFIVALPIGIYFLNNPGDFFGRSSDVSIFSQGSPIEALAISAVKTLGMFNIAGDFNQRHNLAGSPELFWPVGLLFLLGIYSAFKRRGFGDKFTVLWLTVFLLPNILSTEGNPHALRAIGAMPAAMVFAGIGLIRLYEKIQNKIQAPRLKKEFFLLLIVFLFSVGAFEFNKYFNRWAHSPKTLAAFSHGQVEIAGYLNNLPPQTEKYVLWHPDDRATDNGLPVSAQTVYFLTSQKTDITYLRASEINKIKLGENSAVIAPIYYNINLLHDLNKRFSPSKINFIDINTAVLIMP